MLLQIQLPDEAEPLLNNYALRAKRSPEEFAGTIVLQQLEDMEDAAIADRLIREFEESGEPAIPLAEVMKRYGLDD